MELDSNFCGGDIGPCPPEHVFSLKQALALYDFYHGRIAECDAAIELKVAALNASRPVPETPLPTAKHRTKQPGELHFDVRPAMPRQTSFPPARSHERMGY